MNILTIVIFLETALYICMEYFINLRPLNESVLIVKCRQTYHATHISNICSADAGILAYCNMPSWRCAGVTLIYRHIFTYLHILLSYKISYLGPNIRKTVRSIIRHCCGTVPVKNNH